MRAAEARIGAATACQRVGYSHVITYRLPYLPVWLSRAAFATLCAPTGVSLSRRLVWCVAASHSRRCLAARWR